MQNKLLKENDDDMFGGAAPAKPGSRRAKDKDLFGTPKRLVIAKVLRAHAQASIKAIAQAQRRAQAGKAKSYEDAEYLGWLQQLANIMTKVADVFQFKGTAPGWLAYHRALRKFNAEGVEEDIASDLEDAGIDVDELIEYETAMAQVYQGMGESADDDMFASRRVDYDENYPLFMDAAARHLQQVYGLRFDDTDYEYASIIDSLTDALANAQVSRSDLTRMLHTGRLPTRVRWGLNVDNYLREFVEWTELIVNEADKKKQTKTKTDQPGLDPNMFTPRMDQPLARQEPEQPKNQQTDQPRDLRRASAQRTRQATGSITPTDQMSNMLGRLRNIEIDPNLEPYPDTEPETMPSVDVNTRNLPAVASANLQAAGSQSPEFHQVAALPGNMAAMVRQLGRNLFGALTATPTNRIHVVANLGGQGPNTTQEVNAVAGYLRDHGKDLGPGDVDFNQVMPGYQADTHMYSAGGIRWMLVKDFAGEYIYCWPETDSVDYDPQKKLSQDSQKKLR